MNRPTDRRSVLTGLGVLGLSACGRQAGADEVLPRPVPLDLSELEARHGGRLGLAGWDFGLGRQVGWRGDERFVYCSTFKMYLAAATLQRVQEGRERLGRAVPVTRADMVNHAPTTGPAVGSTLTIEQLMEATVGLSDNPAANILIREVGGLDDLRAWYRSIGDTTTRVDRLEPEMNRLDGDKDTTTPFQSMRNIGHLLVGENTPLDARSQAMLKRWMIETPTGPGRIKAGVPAGWTVAHKTGTGGYGPTNDIGVLYPPAGSPVVLAIYYHATRASSSGANDAVIAAATRRALKALGHD